MTGRRCVARGWGGGSSPRGRLGELPPGRRGADSRLETKDIGDGGGGCPMNLAGVGVGAGGGVMGRVAGSRRGGGQVGRMRRGRRVGVGRLAGSRRCTLHKWDG